MAVVDISEYLGRETVELIHSEGGQTMFFPLDVADPAAVRALVDEVVGGTGTRFDGHDG